MMNNDYEGAFSDFLDRHEYDDAEAALFDMVRTAFLAGWMVAGGQPPQAERVFQLLEGGAPDKETK